VVLDVPLNVLAPYDWVIVVRFEQLRDIFHPCFNIEESLATENVGHVSMHGNNGSASEVVAEDTECGDRLPNASEFERAQSRNK